MRWIVAFTLSIAVLKPAPVLAQQDLVGVRALGMGEAVRATATGASGPLLNPAGMTLNHQYVIEGMYGFRAEDLGSFVNVSIVDSVTAKIAAALYYSFLYANPKAAFNWAGGFVPTTGLTRTGHAAGLSLALPLGDRFSIGATVKYLYLSTTAPLPMGAVPSTLPMDSVRGITFDVGLLLKLGDRFNIAAVGYNLWDHGSREAPIELGFGLGFIPIPALTIGADLVIDFTRYKDTHLNASGQTVVTNLTTVRVGPGIEYLVSGKVPIRVGFLYDTWQPSSYFSLGAGFLSTQFGVDLSYRVKTSGGVENFLMLGLRLFVD